MHREQLQGYVATVYRDKTLKCYEELRDIVSQVDMVLHKGKGDIEDLKKKYSRMKTIAAETVKKVNAAIKPVMKTFDKETVDNIKAAVDSSKG